jgi:peptidoglycan/LPS O-acetylase OafA/YrhL
VRETHSKRIPSLDGLRAISIGAVLLGHLAGTRGFPALLTTIIRNPYIDIAYLGVRVFFIISGFLITGLLIAEARRTGSISLKQFYIRRTLRIFPAYFVFLGVMAVFDRTGVIDIATRDFLHAVTYTMNYAPDRGWSLGHLWSLAVEEQFYLVWPITVTLAGMRGAKLVAFSVICLVPLIRIAESTLWPDRRPTIGETFETTADALAVGCLLALSRDALFEKQWYRRAVESAWLAPGLLLLGLVIATRFRPSILIAQTIINCAIALGIDRCVRFPEHRFGKFLNWRPIMFIGTLSYSLYLWQQPFINRGSSATVSMFPINLVAAAGCALLSYYLVERPMLRLRARSGSVASASEALPPRG